jgi:hypothetical protein
LYYTMNDTPYTAINFLAFEIKSGS